MLGAGTWGVALASLLAKNNHEVVLWSAIPREIEELKESGAHKNLPGAILPVGISYTADISVAMADAELCLFVVPSQFIRSTARVVSPHVRDGLIVVNAAKGIESGSLLTMTEVIRDEFEKCGRVSGYHIAALSGPTHAEEVARDLPTTIVSASSDIETARTVQKYFSNEVLRVYTNTDILGVEICGAVKNIIALASGISLGLGYGDNTKAAIVTRGMTEISRLGKAMGCDERTFYGLAGIGDLIVTATSVHSRNNRAGYLIGKGMDAASAIKEVGMVVEGVNAIPAVMELSRKYNVEMPIVFAVNEMVNNGADPHEIVDRIMSRRTTFDV